MPYELAVLVGVWVAAVIVGVPTCWHGLTVARRLRRTAAEASGFQSGVFDELGRVAAEVRVIRAMANRLAGKPQVVEPMTVISAGLGPEEDSK